MAAGASGFTRRAQPARVGSNLCKKCPVSGKTRQDATHGAVRIKAMQMKSVNQVIRALETDAIHCLIPVGIVHWERRISVNRLFPAKQGARDVVSDSIGSKDRLTHDPDFHMNNYLEITR
jgi:hypothetical protein